MIKVSRNKSANFTWHLFAKAPANSSLFEETADFEAYLSIVKEAQQVFSFELHAYCLLSGQVQLLLRAKNYQPRTILQRIHTNYTIYLQNSCGRKQSINDCYFGCRPVSNNRYFIELTKYLHLTPVFAGIVKVPGEYPWSSYASYTGERSGFVSTSRLLHFFPQRPIQSFEEFHTRELPSVSPANLQEIYQSYLDTLYQFELSPKKMPVNEEKEQFITNQKKDSELL